MKKRNKNEFPKDLKDFSLSDLFKVMDCYAYAPSEKESVKKFILENYKEKLSFRFSKFFQHVTGRLFKGAEQKHKESYA